jgi:hypothetical protein
VDLRKFHTQKPLIFEENFIVIGRERAKTLLDKKKLVQFIFTREHWISVDEFSKDATDSP